MNYSISYDPKLAKKITEAGKKNLKKILTKTKEHE